MTTYEILYEGPLVSNNKFYAGVHWTKRNKLTDEYHLVFSDLLRKAKIKKFDEFYINMRFNSRHDCDNVVATLKLFIDCLKGKYVPEDTTKYFKGLEINFDPSLKKNSAIFKIITDGHK